MLNLINLHHSGSSGEVSQTYKLCTAWDPFAVKYSVIQTFLNVRYDLWLFKWRRHYVVSARKQRYRTLTEERKLNLTKN